MFSIPQEAEIIRTYAELDSLVVKPFFGAHYHSLILLGRPGLAKSWRFQERLGPTSHLIKGWTKPVRAVIEVFANLNKLLVFDDAESLWKTELGRVLIRSLCENVPRKVIQCTTTNKDLALAGVPKRFETSSRCAFLVNSFRFGKPDEYEAIIDRSHVFCFDPPPVEVHREVGRWLWPEAQDIYDFVGQRLHLIEDHSARVYLKLWQRKCAGADWKEMLFNRFCLKANRRLVQKLEADPSYPTVEARVAEFIELGGGARSTYFLLKQELQATGQLAPLKPEEVPPIKLTGEPPEEPDLEGEVSDADGEPVSLGGEGGSASPWASPEEDDAEWRSTRPRRSARRKGEQRDSKPEDDLPPKERLRRLIERAIRDENYELARRLKRQLDGLNGGQE